MRTFYHAEDGFDTLNAYSQFDMNYLLSNGSIKLKRPTAYPLNESTDTYRAPNLLDRIKVRITPLNLDESNVEEFYVYLGVVDSNALDPEGLEIEHMVNLAGADVVANHDTSSNSDQRLSNLESSLRIRLNQVRSSIGGQLDSYEFKFSPIYVKPSTFEIISPDMNIHLQPVLDSNSHDPASAVTNMLYDASFVYERRDPESLTSNHGITFAYNGYEVFQVGDTFKIETPNYNFSLEAVASLPNRNVGEFQIYPDPRSTVYDIKDTIDVLISIGGVSANGLSCTVGKFIDGNENTLTVQTTDTVQYTLELIPGSLSYTTIEDYLDGNTSKVFVVYGGYDVSSETMETTPPSYAWWNRWNQTDHDMMTGEAGMEIGITAPQTDLQASRGTMSVNFTSRFGFLANDNHISLPSGEAQVAGLPSFRPHSKDMATDPVLQRGRLIYPKIDYRTDYRPFGKFDYDPNLYGDQPNLSATTGDVEYVRCFDVGFTRDEENWIPQDSLDFYPTFLEWFQDTHNPSATALGVSNWGFPQERIFRFYGVGKADIVEYEIFFKVPGQTGWMDALEPFVLSSYADPFVSLFELSKVDGAPCHHSMAEGIEVLDSSNVPVKYTDVRVFLPNLFINPYIIKLDGAKILFFGETPVLMKIVIAEGSKAGRLRFHPKL